MSRIRLNIFDVAWFVFFLLKLWHGDADSAAYVTGGILSAGLAFDRRIHLEER